MIRLTKNIKKSLLESSNCNRIAILNPYADQNGNYRVLRTIYKDFDNFSIFDPTKLKGETMVYEPKKKLFKWSSHVAYRGCFKYENKKPPTWALDSGDDNKK